MLNQFLGADNSPSWSQHLFFCNQHKIYSCRMAIPSTLPAFTLFFPRNFLAWWPPSCGCHCQIVHPISHQFFHALYEFFYLCTRSVTLRLTNGNAVWRTALLFSLHFYISNYRCRLAIWNDSNSKAISRAFCSVDGRSCFKRCRISSSGIASMNWSRARTSWMVDGASGHGNRLNSSTSSANAWRDSSLCFTRFLNRTF